ncbi:MAG: hypothetical protein MHM6MM_006672 [Cercozoa sp. M6MM]
MSQTTNEQLSLFSENDSGSQRFDFVKDCSSISSTSSTETFKFTNVENALKLLTSENAVLRTELSKTLSSLDDVLQESDDETRFLRSKLRSLALNNDALVRESRRATDLSRQVLSELDQHQRREKLLERKIQRLEREFTALKRETESQRNNSTPESVNMSSQTDAVPVHANTMTSCIGRASASEAYAIQVLKDRNVNMTSAGNVDSIIAERDSALQVAEQMQQLVQRTRRKYLKLKQRYRSLRTTSAPSRVHENCTAPALFKKTERCAVWSSESRKTNKEVFRLCCKQMLFLLQNCSSSLFRDENDPASDSESDQGRWNKRGSFVQSHNPNQLRRQWHSRDSSDDSASLASDVTEKLRQTLETVTFLTDPESFRSAGVQLKPDILHVAA